MALFPERENKDKAYEVAEEASPLKIERKEVITPVSTQFTGKVLSKKGENLIESVDDKKYEIKIPQVSREQMENDLKDSDVEDSNTWSLTYWLRMLKKAMIFGWKAVFSK